MMKIQYETLLNKNTSVWISYDKFNIGEKETEHRIGDERGKFTQRCKFLKKKTR